MNEIPPNPSKGLLLSLLAHKTIHVEALILEGIRTPRADPNDAARSVDGRPTSSVTA